jgi:hypothetical protein
MQQETMSTRVSLKRSLGVMTVLFVTLLMAGTAGSQELAHSQFIPVVARTAGVGGTNWLSDVTVYNATDSQLTVGTQFLPSGQANVFNPAFPDRFTIEARETLIYEDVLNALFGYDTDISGSLLLTVDDSLIAGNPDGARILASCRVYNSGDASGTYGQTVPALSLTINASGTPSIVTGARNDARFRSNLGIVSMALVSSITVHYRVRSGDGTVVVEDAKTLPPSSMSQWSFASLGVPVTEGPLTMELWLDEADVHTDPCATPFPNMFIAYVSKVDGNPQGTGDAEFIYAAPTEPYRCSQ